MYVVVRSTDLPNAMGAQVPVLTNLNINAWEHLSMLGGKDRLMGFIKYGFPTGYAGPPSNRVGVPKHPSINYVPHKTPSKVLLVDACLSGVIGSDGKQVYVRQVHTLEDGAANITKMEAANVVVAFHTLLTPSDGKSHYGQVQQQDRTSKQQNPARLCKSGMDSTGHPGGGYYMITSLGWTTTWLMHSAEHTSATNVSHVQTPW